ncbi:hypothetical protein HNP11_004238, partial [Tsukamurella ocularis]|nr:hypothetical protein [Tsukamurella ocularis]
MEVTPKLSLTSIFVKRLASPGRFRIGVFGPVSGLRAGVIDPVSR